MTRRLTFPSRIARAIIPDRWEVLNAQVKIFKSTIPFGTRAAALARTRLDNMYISVHGRDVSVQPHPVWPPDRTRLQILFTTLHPPHGSEVKLQNYVNNCGLVYKQ